MAGTSPRLPEQFRDTSGHGPDNFTVSELAADTAGSHSPFGDIDFPVPPERLALYQHPTPEERPNLAGGR